MQRPEGQNKVGPITVPVQGEKLVSHVLMMPGAEGCWSERRGKEGLGDGWDGCWVDGTVHDEKYACEARPVGRRLTLGLVPIRCNCALLSIGRPTLWTGGIQLRSGVRPDLSYCHRGCRYSQSIEIKSAFGAFFLRG